MSSRNWSTDIPIGSKAATGAARKKRQDVRSLFSFDFDKKRKRKSSESKDEGKGDNGKRKKPSTDSNKIAKAKVASKKVTVTKSKSKGNKKTTPVVVKKNGASRASSESKHGKDKDNDNNGKSSSPRKNVELKSVVSDKRFSFSSDTTISAENSELEAVEPIVAIVKVKNETRTPTPSAFPAANTRNENKVGADPDPAQLRQKLSSGEGPEAGSAVKSVSVEAVKTQANANTVVNKRKPAPKSKSRSFLSSSKSQRRNLDGNKEDASDFIEFGNDSVFRGFIAEEPDYMNLVNSEVHQNRFEAKRSYMRNFPNIFLPPADDNNNEYVEEYPGVFKSLANAAEGTDFINVGHLKILPRTIRPLENAQNNSCFWILQGTVKIRSTGALYSRTIKGGQKQTFMVGKSLMKGTGFVVPKETQFTIENWDNEEALLGFSIQL